MVALAADRWVRGLEDRSREASYIVQLIENLSTDSARLGVYVGQADEHHRFAVSVLDGSVDTLIAQPAVLLRRLETLSWWAPLDYTRETWDDMVATGGVQLLHDPELRIALSRYYNMLEYLATIEQGWDEQLAAAFTYRLAIMPPLTRIQVMGALPAEKPPVPVTPDDARRALRTIRDDASMSGHIGNIALIYRGQSNFYGQLQGLASEVLALLRGFSPEP